MFTETAQKLKKTISLQQIYQHELLFKLEFLNAVTSKALMKLRDDVEVKIRPTASLVHVGSVA
jgi:uncharacterized protein (DUF1499 family)